jgi:hypothetical protein
MQGYFDDRRADDVSDELHAKAIVLQNDDTAMAIVVCDIIGTYKEYIEIARSRAAELTGIPAENVFVSATHTHYGPTTLQLAHLPMETEYTEWAMERAADAVKLAYNRLRPAMAGHTSAYCPEETHNRRWHLKDGTVKTNPGFLNPDLVRPAGPKDPEIATAVFLDEDRDPIAVLSNYSLHYVGSSHHTALSANYFGAFGRALQRMAGREFVAIMANGCCGDINNNDFSRAARVEHCPGERVEQVANTVAARVYASWQQIRDYSPETVLAADVDMVDFRRRELPEEELAVQRTLYESKDDPSDVDWIYALEAVSVSELPVVKPTPVMGLRIGELGILGMGGEMFCDYGLQIKAHSPFARTMTVELANDFLGYCATDVALEQGGYETRLCRWALAAPGTEKQMVDAAVGVLDALHSHEE